MELFWIGLSEPERDLMVRQSLVGLVEWEKELRCCIHFSFLWVFISEVICWLRMSMEGSWGSKDRRESRCLIKLVQVDGR